MDRILKFEISEEQRQIMDKLINGLKNKVIPREYPKDVIYSFGSYEYRNIVIKLQGFPLITEKNLDPIIKYIGDKKCLEVMAGTGSFSYYLKSKGVDIIATDNHQWELSGRWSESWCNIENIDCVEAIGKYSDREVIIISWPYMDSNAYKCLLKMREVNPKATMIYIGEWCCGCTANDDFFENLNIINNDYITEANKNYNNWFGIHDRIYLVN